MAARVVRLARPPPRLRCSLRCSQHSLFLPLLTPSSSSSLASSCFPLSSSRVSPRRCVVVRGGTRKEEGPLRRQRKEEGKEEGEEESEEWIQLRKEAAEAKKRGGKLGEVYLVGAGPGDAGLLTLRALELLKTADVVLRDRLLSEEVMSFVNPQARVEFVGKSASFHTRSQEEIHELLYIFAETGKKVVRLKGGDPFVFGRGGEELEYLTERGVKVTTVPGITASCGICASLGIPFTYRGLADSVHFLTGHLRDGIEPDFDTAVYLASTGSCTLVVYMGLQTLPLLSSLLLSSSTSPSTPCAAIERGTTAEERVVVAPLASFAEEVEEKKLGSPTLLVLGKVVSLSRQWKERMAKEQEVVDVVMEEEEEEEMEKRGQPQGIL